MPLQVAVSQVLAGQGILWIAVHFEPGDLVKTADAPEVADTRPRTWTPSASTA